MDINFIINFIRQQKEILESEGAETEIILGVYVLDEIMNFLLLQLPTTKRNYKDIKLFGSTVHVDFKNINVVKICKVTTKLYI